MGKAGVIGAVTGGVLGYITGNVTGAYLGASYGAGLAEGGYVLQKQMVSTFGGYRRRIRGRYGSAKRVTGHAPGRVTGSAPGRVTGSKPFPRPRDKRRRHHGKLYPIWLNEKELRSRKGRTRSGRLRGRGKRKVGLVRK